MSANAVEGAGKVNRCKHVEEEVRRFKHKVYGKLVIKRCAKRATSSGFCKEHSYC